MKVASHDKLFALNFHFLLSFPIRLQVLVGRKVMDEGNPLSYGTGNSKGFAPYVIMCRTPQIPRSADPTRGSLEPIVSSSHRRFPPALPYVPEESLESFLSISLKVHQVQLSARALSAFASCFGPRCTSHRTCPSTVDLLKNKGN